LLREFMGDKISVTALAKHLGVTRTNLSLSHPEREGWCLTPDGTQAR
jgi:plasmid maintenance system antidote protein VapI